jgi:hypothetical protein
MNLKSRWLNLMLHFSGVINIYKLKVIETTGPKIILYGFCVLLLEIVNILISLPAYAFISSKEFAGSDVSAIRTYRLRRIASLSVIAGMVFSIFVWILVSFFGLVLFPGKSDAAVASWDFNTPLAYNYDTTKIQITDGTAIFKAQVSTPSPAGSVDSTLPTSDTTTETPPVDTTTDTSLPATEPAPTTETVTEPVPEPVVEPTPAPVVEPAPAPVVEPAPAPAPDPGPLLFDNLRQLFNAQVAYAQTDSQANTCSATLQTITPLLVTPFVKWTGFSETANKVGGEIYYTLSGDGGVTWLYWNGSSWVDAGTNKGNTAIEINSHISDFPITLTQAGAGTLMFKATFESDCGQDISLLSLTADYQDQPSVIASFTNPETGAAASTTVITSEADPTVVAVGDSISTGTDTSTGGTTETTIPVTDTSVVTDTATTSVDTSLTTDTTVNTDVATPIAFSVHIVTETTGTPGRMLYSIPGLLSISEGPDNGLIVNVTGTDLQTTTLSYPESGSSANVAVGDHIIVLVYDGTTLKLYIDGAVTASLTTPIVIAPPAQVSTSIGCVSAGFILEALTLAQINANHLECGNQAPTVNITEATQKADDGFVDILYTTTDADNDFVSIPVYEYSTTGAFAGEESRMTAATLDIDHDGTNGLVARNTGTEHTFVWNAKADLPNYAGNVYVRLRANDGLITGPVETFYPVRIDTKAPVISSFEGTQTNDIGTVTLSYGLSDTNTPVAVTLSLSSDNGLTWVVPTSSANGAIGDVNTGTRTIFWNADANLPNFEGTITARIATTDAYGNESITTTDFAVDTRAPIGLAAFRGVESNTNQILWHWSPSDDTNFDRYIITYGTDSQSITNGSLDNPTNVSLWGPSRDSDLLIAGTDRTVITGLTADTLYYAKITAYDDYGHEQTSVVASFRTQTEAVVEGSVEIIPDSGATEEIYGDISVGEILPDNSTLPPSAPSGGFRIVINENATETGNRNVTLALTGGIDAALMLISNNSDLSGASLQEYASSTIWNVCEGLDSCESGTYRVYAKFYTSFGIGGTIVSDSIVLNISVPVTPSENSESVTETPQAEASSGGGTSVSVGGSSSGGGGNGPIIALTTNENRDGSGSSGTNKVNDQQPSGHGSTDGVQAVSEDSGSRGGLPSSFVSTADSVLQNTPELKSIAESRESGVLARPEVALVEKSLTGQTINFTGTGIPKAKIALFIHSDQVVVHTTDADAEGKWSFSHDQGDLELAEGEHTVFAVTYDPGSKVKSKPSIVSTFYVNKSPAAVILGYTNLPTTLLTLVVLLFGTLYIYSRRREKIQNA